MRIMTLLYLLVFSSVLFASENQLANKQLNKKIKRILHEKYFSQMLLLEKNYNEDFNRLKFQKKISFLKINSNQFPEELPKASFTEGLFKITKIGLTISFNDFINNSIHIGAKLIQTNCKIKNECYFDLFNKLKAPKETGYNFSIFSKAFAANSSDGPSCADNFADRIAQNTYAKDDEKYRDKIIKKCKIKSYKKRNTRFVNHFDSNLIKVFASILHLENAGVKADSIGNWNCTFCLSTESGKRETSSKNFKIIEKNIDDILVSCNINKGYYKAVWNNTHDIVDIVSENSSGMKKLMYFMSNDYLEYNSQTKNKAYTTISSELFIDTDMEKISDKDLKHFSCENIFERSNLPPEKEVKEEERSIKLKIRQAQIKLKKSMLDLDFDKSDKFRKKIKYLNQSISALYIDSDVSNHLRNRNQFCSKVSSLKQCMSDLYSQRGRMQRLEDSELGKDVRQVDEKIKVYNKKTGATQE